MEGFQERNPNLYVFNAVLHLDESTPHLHIDYIPVGHFKSGLEVRNAKNKALEEMNFGKDAKANNRWRLSEWDILKNICNAHGIEISEPKKSRGYSYTVQEYGEYQDKINALTTEIERLTAERDETVDEFQKLSKKKVNITEIESIEAKESMFGKKVTLTKEDYDKLSDTAKKYIAMEKSIKNLKKERDAAVQECDKLKKKYDSTSAELAIYKKKEDEKRHITRDKLKAENQRIADKEKLQKAMAFISACGLSEDFSRYKYNKSRNLELE